MGCGGAKAMPLRLRNTFSQFRNTGAAVESLIPDFIGFMPVMGRASHRLVRSIDMRYWEGYAVGDIAIVTDIYPSREEPMPKSGPATRTLAAL